MGVGGFPLLGYRARPSLAVLPFTIACQIHHTIVPSGRNTEVEPVPSLLLFGSGGQRKPVLKFFTALVPVAASLGIERAKHNASQHCGRHHQPGGYFGMTKYFVVVEPRALKSQVCFWV
jgi:hypothetical protein